MAQLIKLQDYISRYEQNILHYPSTFVRLKKQQWLQVVNDWENKEEETIEIEGMSSISNDWFIEEKEPILNKLKGLLKLKKKDSSLNNVEIMTKANLDTENDLEEEKIFAFEPNYLARPKTKEELKKQFLNQLFHFQMKWASSTLTEKSYVDRRFYYDSDLIYFLQRFPDTFLILYKPVFLINKAPVELDIIIISPTDVWCITVMAAESSTVFIGSKDHFWVKRNQNNEEKVLNPILGLNRMEKIVKNIFTMYDIELPVHKVVLCRDGFIDFPSGPYDIKFIEQRNYNEWFQFMRKQRSPLKHMQLKGAQCLLQYCQTTSFRRLEWENYND